MRYWIVIAAVLLVSIVPIHAQEADCTHIDVLDAIANTNFVDAYNTVVRDFTSMRSVAEVDAGIENATTVYHIWWDEIMPEIEHCRGDVVDIVRAGSRAVDELLITTLYTRTMTVTLLENNGVATPFFEEIAERTSEHADNVVEYYGIIIEFIEETLPAAES